MPEPVVLTDGTVTLRAFARSDVDEMVVTARDPQTQRWTPTPADYDRTAALRWVEDVVPDGWRDGSAFRWAIEAPGPGGGPRFAGRIDLRVRTPPDVAFFLAPWARGRGTASRALRLAADWGFDVAGLPVLHWAAPAGHLASWRVAHACGFAFTGTGTADVATRDGLVDGWHAALRPDPATPVARRAPCTTWWPTPVLTGDRVRLRPYADADVPRLIQACSDEASRYWSATLPHPFAEDEARALILLGRLEASLGRTVAWAVADPDDDRLLGDVVVHGMDEPHLPTGGEIGYRAHPDARGRGMITEAVRLAVGHAFTPTADGGLGRTRLQLGASARNAASRRVAQRCGFRLVGRFREAGVIGLANEMVDDGVWYELLPTDPAPGDGG